MLHLKMCRFFYKDNKPIEFWRIYSDLSYSILSYRIKIIVNIQKYVFKGK